MRSLIAAVGVSGLLVAGVGQAAAEPLTLTEPSTTQVAQDQPELSGSASTAYAVLFLLGSSAVTACAVISGCGIPGTN
ncbi:hypothetical protein ACWDOP_15300 [Nocardia sp. NPDC003693]